MESQKISTRRYARLLALLIINDKGMAQEFVIEEYVIKLLEYLPQYFKLPLEIQNRIIFYAQKIIQNIRANYTTLKNSLNLVSKNRKLDEFIQLDQAILLVGASELNYGDTPSIIVKEMLILSDMLENQHAVPYISGILKTLAFGQRDKAPDFKNKRVFLKKREGN